VIDKSSAVDGFLASLYAQLPEQTLDFFRYTCISFYFL